MLDAISLGLGVALRHQWLEMFASGLLVEMASLSLTRVSLCVTTRTQLDTYLLNAWSFA